MLRTTLTALLAITLLGPAGAWADDAAGFFDDSEVREVRLYFDDPDWYDVLYDSHDSDPEDPYFEARFQYGTLELDPVGVRFKGNSSFRRNGVKKSFKLDFNEFDDSLRFLGLKKLNLNNLDLQPDFLREKLFLDFAGRFMPAMRAVHVNVYVNDELWGLYLAIEQPDKTMMESRFGDEEDGNLYRAGETNADLSYLGSDPSSYYDRYELRTNETENDYSGLIEFLDVLNNTAATNLPEALEPICDVENMLYGLSVNNLFSNLESYIGVASEYFLYDRDDTGQFVHVHWDCNETFGTTGDGTPSVSNPMALEVFYLPSGGGPPIAQKRSSDDGEGVSKQQPPGGSSRPLAENLWEVDEYRQVYLQQIARMVRSGFDVDSIHDRIQELADLIRVHVYADPHKAFTNAEFEAALTSSTSTGQLTIWGLEEFVAGRFDYVRPVLDTYAQPSDFRLNELVAVNDGSLLDGEGEADPWLEVYNLGPGPLTTDELYLTDDAADPLRWALPIVSTDDGDFVVVWLDGETSEGDDHASFALQPGGGTLSLYSDSTGSPVLIDSVDYPALGEGVAWIRLGYFGSLWGFSSDATPDAENPESGGVSAVGAEDLRINELMADNYAFIEDPDEPGAYDDWIEIYNPGDTDVDMGGLYMTDDLSEPTKWQVPAGVIAPAHGFVVIWADDDTEQGAAHANFKLSADGEEAGLFAADGTTQIDSVTFGEQETDVSIGRLPDGDGQWVTLDTATPGSANSSIDLVFSDDFESGGTSYWDSAVSGG